MASLLREREGLILFQLPPTFTKDVARLDAFLKHIVGRAKVAFEFRHASWLNEETFDCLRAHSASLVIAEDDTSPNGDVVRTADWGYVHLQGETYSDEILRDRLMRIRSHQWAQKSYFIGNCFRFPNSLAVLREVIAELANEPEPAD